MEYVRPFAALTLDDVPLVGGKNASLGEMVRQLGERGVRVPDGFAITADAYRAMVDAPAVREVLDRILGRLDPEDLESLRACGAAARRLIREAPLPEGLQREIAQAYRKLSRSYGREEADVAVRSSATAEDLPEASFAGQQETYLNVHGVSNLVEACRRCFASLFSDRAISYRSERGFDHRAVALSIGVQKMVRSDLAGAGVMFTLDTETGFENVVLLTAVWGLGENIVQGIVDPDEYLVFKPTLTEISRRLGAKQIKLVYDEGGGRGTRNLAVPENLRRTFVLSREEVRELARCALEVERHYAERAGRQRALDLEWAKDGLTGELFVLQARPETAHVHRRPTHLVRFELRERGPVLCTGRAVGDHIGSGPVVKLAGAHAMDRFPEGHVLVTAMTDPDWEPILRRAAAVVTDRGGRTCHAAIVSRELGIPCIVGTGHATQVLEDGQEVTVSCAEGETGLVYEGLLRFDRRDIDLAECPRTRTRIYLNIGNPDQAFQHSFLPVDGVGLAREEFIIMNSIGIHPMAALHPERLDAPTRAEIETRAQGYLNPAEFFEEKLAEGIAKIAAAFHPRPVTVRLSDFKSDEYAQLLGGRPFEPVEANPMIGLRGAARYGHRMYRDAFALECRALRRVREEMGLRNVIVMIPFCRTLDEAERVQKEMARHGLERGREGLEVWMMCEIPSNVLLIEEFAAHFDGFSIGSNDLTQLVLGVDRDSEILSELFDERDPAVLRALRQAVEGAHRAGRPIGICGQAPSDRPAVAEMLVRAGIDSLSLSPDAVFRTRLAIAELERVVVPKQIVWRSPKMSEIPKRITEFLKKSRIDFEVIEHPLDFTAQETAAHTHTKGKEFAKTVFLKVDGRPAMAVLPAHHMVDLEAARTSIGATDVSLAHEDEIAKICPDCDVGAAPPFGNLYDVPVYVSPSLTEDERVTFNAGSHRDAVRMAYSDFERLVRPRVVSMSRR